MQAGVLLSELYAQPPDSTLLFLSFSLVHFYYTFRRASLSVLKQAKGTPRQHAVNTIVLHWAF